MAFQCFFLTTISRVRIDLRIQFGRKKRIALHIRELRQEINSWQVGVERASEREGDGGGGLNLKSENMNLNSLYLARRDHKKFVCKFERKRGGEGEGV